MRAAGQALRPKERHHGDKSWVQRPLTPTGAWHAMRDAAEHKASADQAVLERLEREEGQTGIQNPEPEPDDEQDLGR